MATRRKRTFSVLTGLLWIATFLLALTVGAVEELEWALILELRLPRVILAAAVGCALAVAGAVLQALFANPLCEPYTLGISSGSALGAVAGAALGLEMAWSGLAGSAFLGALAFAGVLYMLSLKRGVGSVSLLLAGVMLGFLGSSLVALWMALADPMGVQAAVFWLMGDLSRARLEGAVPALLSASFLTILVWLRWRDMDALILGEEGARSLGVPIQAARKRLIFLSSLLVGMSVSAAGMIGFVGLVVPHLIRIWQGSLHRRLIPLAAFWGSITLMLADVAARRLGYPYELPVGVLTAILGAPVFLWIMLQRKTVMPA